jgi:hypothetical protein
MTKLALAAFALAGLTQATGCIAADEEAQFSLSWTISQGAAPSDCTVIGANGVSFVFTGPGQAFDDIYDCEPTSHDSPSMILGAYTISGSLINDADQANVIIFDQLNVTSSLDVVDELKVVPTFAFDAPSAAQDVGFGVDFGVAGGDNCTSTGAGGSGVVQQQIDLYDLGAGTCLATFHITGTDQENLAFDDLTCAPALCYENSVTQTINALPPGDYTMDVTGFKGAVGAQLNACYYGTKDFTVPVTGADIGNVIAAFDPLPADDAACNATKPGQP